MVNEGTSWIDTVGDYEKGIFDAAFAVAAFLSAFIAYFADANIFFVGMVLCIGAAMAAFSVTRFRMAQVKSPDEPGESDDEPPDA